MQNSLLNSIYVKISQDSGNGLQSVVDKYVKNIYILYLDVLDKSNVTDLEEKVKIKTTFADGYVLEHTQEAGYYLINLLFDSPEYQSQVEKIDNDFLSSCDCENKEKILHILKAIITETGSETIKSKDWNNISENFKDCNSYITEEDDDFNDDEI